MRILFSVVTVTYHNMVFQLVTNDENAIDRISQSRIARNIRSVLKPHHKLNITSRTYCMGKGKCYHASLWDVSNIQTHLKEVFKRKDLFLVCSCSATISGKTARHRCIPSAISVR
ncbi:MULTISPECIES: hypothetical protein [Clostridiaceae]|uniref:Uncharacterized protein n=1 Tax=Clostridium facile TaxID=2763035 RepID=A0ABR7IQU1_9CLOT|nr:MULTISPECIES: hypothetical protein [Clostridiaceae]MBC5787519.1 hypothetical protein [Clostridium facile]